jgi:hypothetical protein
VLKPSRRSPHARHSSAIRRLDRRENDAGRPVIPVWLALLLVAGSSAAAGARAGVAPVDPWNCPASHPIKGYASVESGRRIYFIPGNPFYDEASPEQCYASEDEALSDGSRPAEDPRRSLPSGGLVRLGGIGASGP